VVLFFFRLWFTFIHDGIRQAIPCYLSGPFNRPISDDDRSIKFCLEPRATHGAFRVRIVRFTIARFAFFPFGTDLGFLLDSTWQSVSWVTSYIYVTSGNRLWLEDHVPGTGWEKNGRFGGSAYRFTLVTVFFWVFFLLVFAASPRGGQCSGSMRPPHQLYFPLVFTIVLYATGGRSRPGLSSARALGWIQVD
jgi:hypothetical protein